MSGFCGYKSIIKSASVVLISFFWSGVVMLSVTAQADSTWYPFPVEIHHHSDDDQDEAQAAQYIPLKAANKSWHICTSFPHMKDSYWLAVNFGVVNEARRLGVSVRLYEAGGYDNLKTQIKQIRQCVAQGSDGVIIGAISYDGLNDLVRELDEQGIPVIDVINGMSSDRVKARSLVSFEEMGYRIGKYLAERHPLPAPEVKVAWFPGPEGAGWVLDGDKGFQKAVHGSAINVVAKRYGDTGKTVQVALLEEVLEAYPNLDYIVGTAVTAAAAVKVLRTKGLNKQVKILSYYFTPEVYRGIKREQILGAPTDSAVIQGRIAVDQLVRVLEKKKYIRHVGPKIYVIDQQNIDSFERPTSLAPSGFRAVYSVGVRLKEN